MTDVKDDLPEGNSGNTTITQASSSIRNKIEYCVSIILREAKLEDRLVKQLLYTMLSAYSQNPMNLFVNAPAGEGKSYIINKVADSFPANDVLILAGMSDKALFHRQGRLVVWSPDAQQYEDIEPQLKEIDLEILEAEMQDGGLDKNSRVARVYQLEQKKKELLKDAKKLIELEHKILVFLDTPRMELMSALMPLLSHDKYEVEYEYVDTSGNGIRTKSNILRGWPAVIMAAAIDYNNNARFAEMQRRFIITNPKMTEQKYKQSNVLIATKLGMPDLVYQKLVVSKDEHQQAKLMIEELKYRILDLTKSDEPGRNNVFIPFADSVVSALPSHRAYDMTTTHRFFTYTTLMPLLSSEGRPKLKLQSGKSIPFATFADLKESMFLMEYANGVRPYILEWYHEVLLPTYNCKTEPDRKQGNKEIEILTEKRIAVMTDDLRRATREIQGKDYSTQQLLQSFIYPLLNQNYIDKTDSDLDKRAKVYFPIVQTEDIKLFKNDEMNNLSQSPKIKLTDSTKYPDKAYIKSQIEQIIGYYSATGPLRLLDDSGQEITIEDMLDRYYADPDSCFLKPDGKLSEEYRTDIKNRNDSQDRKPKDENNTELHGQQAKELFIPHRINNLIHSAKTNDNVFINICKEISEGFLGDGTITFEKLHRELVISGKYTASEATQAINDAVKEGKLMEIGWHLFTLPKGRRESDGEAPSTPK